MSLTKKLQLYRKQLHDQNAASKQSSQSIKSAEYESEQDKEIQKASKLLNAEIRRFEDQYVLVHSEMLPLDLKIGPYVISELFPLVNAWQSAYDRHPLSAKGLRAGDLLFFDTETTGLGSGTGQMIFLIGMARLTRNELELSQYLLPGPGHETAFYDAFLSDCRSLKNLVTFNGKAFDWPRVKTRHQFVRRQVPKLPPFGHFDLLHASRRLWKKKLESVRLQTVENEILSMGRKEDVPGKMAPFLYFQFLKHPDAHLIKGIMEHNREDVLTLISLYIHLSNKILNRIESDPEEQYEIARWNEQVGDRVHAQQIWEKLIREASPYQSKAKWHLAELYKREGEYLISLNLFKSAIRESGDDQVALCIETAKLLEHQFKDYAHALHYTKQALKQFYQKHQNDLDSVRKKEAEYLKRLNRLDQRIENNS
ncbi:ribonuclease H-like domain-containing protein [Sporolactobacillus shoreicorticis]|nr:ribonuclease H-like domain-containing protein [Sporolactobacillus shoreicorticis]MCO7125732.1 ribonuclease H-like domain-containing protein [Sporolactobacillus shoreicorticis]